LDIEEFRVLLSKLGDDLPLEEVAKIHNRLDLDKGYISIHNIKIN
jgi:hypothetical protein